MYSRVTTAGMYKTLLGSLQGNLGNLQDLQRQMSTWNKYAKLSDNPAAISRSLEIKSAVDANEKYMENSDNAVTMLKYSHGALNSALSAAEKIQELVIQAGNPALTSSELQDITDQIKAEKDAIIDALNTKVAGQYIFGGTDTATPPFTLQPDGSVKYNGADERIQYALGDGLLGDVSFTGSEIVPNNENSYFICSHKVDLDWQWTGREEKVQITVGNRTLPVYIPEHWIDEVATDKTKSTDYNRFRDPGEVSGISLDDLATLINRSLEEQGADMLVNAYVDKNLKTNEQQLIIKSISGEKIGITGWTDTDYMPVPQTLSGLQFAKIGTTAGSDVAVTLPDWNENVLGGMSDINLTGLAGKTITLMSGNNSVTHEFSADPADTEALISELDTAFSGLNIKSSIQNNKLVLTSSTGAEIRASGSALTNLLGSSQLSSEKPEYHALMGTENVMSWRDDRMGKGINITLEDSNGSILADENFEFSGCNSISDLIDEINNKMPVSAGDAPFASTISGRLVFRSTQGVVTVSDISGTSGGTAQLFGDDALNSSNQVVSSTSSLSIQVGDNQAVKIFINKDDNLDDIAAKINAIEGVYSRASADGDQLIVTAQRTGALDNSLTVSETQESLHYPQLRLEADGAAKKLFDFSFTTDAVTGIQTGSLASQPTTRAVDHSHMDVFDVLGMETGMKSIEFTKDQKLTVEAGKPLHWRVISGGHTADITLNEGEYDLTALADRLKNAGAGWLEVTVDVFNPSGVNQDESENGIATSYNSEEATQRLVIRGYNGEQVLFLDMNEQHYADELGLSTALRAEPNMGMSEIKFPTAPCVDDRLGIKMRVQMNCGMSYDVNIVKSEVVDKETGLVDRVKVMQSIVNQVNAQEGENVMGISIPVNDAGSEIPNYASIYFNSGESFTVVDLPFSDPEWSDYSGGIAAQMGIHGGVTSNLAKTDNPLLDRDTIQKSGTIRFSNLAHSVEIDVAAGDTVKSVMDRLRSQAGDWLYVNYYDTHMGQMDADGNLGGRNSGDFPIIAISSVDGSAVSITDVKYDNDGSGNFTGIAQDMFGISTGVQGNKNLAPETVYWEEGETPGRIFTINVAGYTHNIDMTAMRDVNGNGKMDAYDLVAAVNARMQDYDLQAELNDDNFLVLWSPRGYSFDVSVSEVDADGNITADLTSDFLGTTAQKKTYYRGGYGLENAASTRTATGIHTQNATIRSGSNTTKQNAFGMIDDVISAVKAGNRDTLSDVMLPRINNFIDNLLSVMSSNGALQNRYESNVERLTKDNVVMTESYDKLVKVDPAEIATQMLMASYMYQANLSVISQLIQPSLLDFLS